MKVALKVPPTTGRDDADPDLRAVAPKGPFIRWLGGTGAWVFMVDIALVALFTILSPGRVFFTAQNFSSIALTTSAALLLALAMAFLLGAGVIDLSLGANLVLSSVIGAKVIIAIAGGASGSDRQVSAVLIGLVSCVLAGVAFGLLNALIIEFLHVNSFIATLGTLGVGQGVALLVTQGADIGGLPLSMQTDFAFRTVLGLPLPAVVALLGVLALWVTVRFLRFGIHALAIGSSRPAADRAGIRTRRHIVIMLMTSGSLAGLAGFISLANFASTTVNGHANDSLNAITAAVIGGTALAGGRINAVGTLWGAILASVLQAGLVIIGVQSFWQLVAVGAVLVAAVALDSWNSARRR